MGKTELTDNFLKEMKNIDFDESFKQKRIFSKKEFVISDLGLSARNYQQWKDLRITPPVQKDNKKETKREWVRFNFVEYVWMKIVISLRDLGYPYADIEKAKGYLFESLNFDVGEKLSIENPDIVGNLIEHFTNGELSKELKEVAEDIIKNPDFLNKISSLFSKQRTRLEVIIFQAIAQKKDEIGLGFFKGGECEPFNWNLFVSFDKWHPNIKKVDVLNATIRKPHIYISITKYIMDFISEDEKQEHEISMVMLSTEELSILRELRSKEYKNIIINYDKGNDTKIIKTEKEKKIKESEVKDFIKQVLFAPNSKITYTTTKKGDLIINTILTKKLNK
jgi:hypothetical protein